MNNPRPPYAESLDRLNAMAAPANERWREGVREAGGDPETEQMIATLRSKLTEEEKANILAAAMRQEQPE